MFYGLGYWGSALLRRVSACHGALLDLLHPGRAKEPRSEEWYDEPAWEGAESDGVLFIYPYGTLFFGVGGIAGLVESVNPPEFVTAVLKYAVIAALILFFIGLTGPIGVPLPWPFVPKWVVDIRKAKRARRRERRQARKREREE